MSAEHVVALFTAGGMDLAVDASSLEHLELCAEDANDIAAALGLPANDVDARCGRFTSYGVWRLGPRVDVVVLQRSDLFALPPLLEALEQRGIGGFVRRGTRLHALIDLGQLVTPPTQVG